MSRTSLWLLLAAVLLAASCGFNDVPPSDGPTPPPKEEPTADAADPLRTRIEAAIRHVARRELHTDDPFWTVFHGVLGLGPDLMLLDPRTGNRVKALDYFSAPSEPLMPGLLFTPTAHGVKVEVGTGLEQVGVWQGHQDQFVAEALAEWGAPLERRFTIRTARGDREATTLDFVRQSQMQASADEKKKQELSWAVVVVGQYLGTDAKWTNAYGESMHFDDMMRHELRAEVEGAACGGTHRLFGLTWALHLHLLRGGKRTGVWAEVDRKNAHFHERARRHQAIDGSFSANFFRPTALTVPRPDLPGADGSFTTRPLPGQSSDRYQRINTTGHIVEWLALSLPDDELRVPWVRDAVNALTLMLLDVQDLNIDALHYHAAHGLYIYYARVYGYGPFIPQKSQDWTVTAGPEQLLIPLPPEWKQVGPRIGPPLAAKDRAP